MLVCSGHWHRSDGERGGREPVRLECPPRELAAPTLARFALRGGQARDPLDDTDGHRSRAVAQRDLVARKGAEVDPGARDDVLRELDSFSKIVGDFKA